MRFINSRIRLFSYEIVGTLVIAYPQQVGTKIASNAAKRERYYNLPVKDRLQSQGLRDVALVELLLDGSDDWHRDHC